MMISCQQSITGVQWWYNKINCSKNNITKGDFVTRGKFSLDKMECHINAKKLLAAKFSLKTLVKISETHVKFLSDNTTAHGVNNKHSNKSELFHYIISEIRFNAMKFVL